MLNMPLNYFTKTKELTAFYNEVDKYPSLICSSAILLIRDSIECPVN